MAVTLNQLEELRYLRQKNAKYEKALRRIITNTPDAPPIRDEYEEFNDYGNAVIQYNLGRIARDGIKEE